MNNISNIQLFVKVVEEGSFSAVARSMGITPSAVSRQISQLEKELQGRLFQRTTRKQSLTEAGEIYFQHARRLVEDIEMAKLAVNKVIDKPSGNLRISAEADFSLAFIEPILPEFLKQYPEIQVCLIMSSIQEDLVDENLDLAIRMGHLEDSSLIARKLLESKSVVCASPAYLSKHPKLNHPNDLKSHNCLSFRTRMGANHWRFDTRKKPVDILIKGNLNINNLAFLRKAALNDLGVVMIPTWMIQDDLKQGRLIPILQDCSVIPSSTPINAVFTHKRQLAPKTRAFIDFLSNHLTNI